MEVRGYKIEPQADLEGADLEYAYLRDANLEYAYLEDANLRCADLDRKDILEIQEV